MNKENEKHCYMEFLIPQINESSFTIEIEKGEVVVFLGANGSGKSRLGEFINRSVYLNTEQGLAQLHVELEQFSTELNGIELSINTLESHYNSYSSKNDAFFLSYASDYQSVSIQTGIKEFKSRAEILEMFFNGEIRPNDVQYVNVLIHKIPPTSLEEIDGGKLIFGGLEFEIDLMKVKQNDPKSIFKAKEYLLSSIKNNLDQHYERRKMLERQVYDIRNKISILDKPKFNFCHRIAAHRSLVVSKQFNLSYKEEAVLKLLHGVPIRNLNNFSKNNDVGKIQDDFGDLLCALVSEEADTGARLNQDVISEARIQTNLATLKNIWNELLPHRRIKIEGLKIYVESDESTYDLDHLSEGERSIFYIIGQCLFVPKDSIIIIDEPDIHIHKSIVNTLFDSIQKYRQDCAFIYISHDIDFVSSRIGKKYIINDFKRFNNDVNYDRWDIAVIDYDQEIPESIVNLILGSRRHVLFVEGQEGRSIDAIYKYIYSEFKVIMVGGCENIIQMTKAANNIQSFHRVKCYGIIDRDSRSKQELDQLLKHNVFAINYAILENVFLVPEVASEIYKLAKVNFVENEFVFKATQWLLQNDEWIRKVKLNRIARKVDEWKRLNDVDEFKRIIGEFNVSVCIDEVNAEFDSLKQIENPNEKLLKILEFSRNKGVLNDLSIFLNIGRNIDQFKDFLFQNITNLAEVLRKHLPKLT